MSDPQSTSSVPEPAPQTSSSSPDVPGVDDAASAVTAANAAAILAAGDEEPAQPGRTEPTKGTSRRNALLVGGLAVVAAAAGGGWWATRSRKGAQGVVGAVPTLPLVIGGDICAAPLYAAYHKGFFDDAGLNVTLARTQRTEDTKDAVGAGKYIGAPGIFFSWLEPIYNGVNAKLTGGFHSGCLEIVVPKDSSLQSLADLRGKSIGVPSLASSAFSYFAIGLAKAGLNVDPEHGDVTWVTIDEDSLATRLANGDVDAIMGSDPAPILPVLDGTGRVLASNKDEAFCCSVALNGDFVTAHPAQAKALTEAWFKGSDYLAASQAHRAEIAKIEVDNSYVAAELDVVEKIMETYGWDASATRFREAIEPGIEEFKATGYIKADVGARALADAVYADLGITR